ncbi:MAG: hypothetical protein H7Y20_01240 [Bryobacteraceae bacterium]|nr:hypothetical protein [Bryobacteraceae bacterium]
MKKFHFPFQRAMDWREHRADLEKTELEKLHGVRDKLQSSRQSVKTELESIGRTAGTAVTTRAEDLHLLAAFSDSLRNLDQRLKSEAKLCAGEIVTQHEKCIKADRDHQLLTRLHDDSRRRWTYEADREVEQTASESWNAGWARTARQAKNSE